MEPDLEHLYTRHRAEWIRLARHWVGQDAEDAVHDAMVEALESLPNLTSLVRIESSILRISKTIQQRERRRGIVNAREETNNRSGRSRARVIRPEGLEDKPKKYVEMVYYDEPAHDLQVDIQRALEQVDAPLVLRTCVEGEWLKTLAIEQKCSKVTVFKHLGSALKTLEGLLEPYRDNRKHRFTRRVH